MLETSSLLGAIVFATVLTVEVALRLPLGTVMRRTIAAARKAAHVVSSKRISDHWKEKAIRAYAGQLFTGALSLLAMMIVLLGLYGLIVIGAGMLWIPDFDVLHHLSQPFPVLATVMAATVYIPARLERRT